MSIQLKSLVRESADPRVYAFVLTNLGKNVPVNTEMYRALWKIRLGLVAELPKLYVNPRLSLQLAYEAKVNRLEDFVRELRPKLVHPEHRKPLDPSDFLRARIPLFQDLLQQQFQQMVKLQKEHQEMLEQVWDGSLKEKEEVLHLKLMDPVPAVRWMSIQAITKNRYHQESRMIDLLGDSHPQVRQAAHQSLVVLSRGNNFGPTANASSRQLQEARERWREWLDGQELSTVVRR